MPSFRYVFSISLGAQQNDSTKMERVMLGIKFTQELGLNKYYPFYFIFQTFFQGTKNLRQIRMEHNVRF